MRWKIIKLRLCVEAGFWLGRTRWKRLYCWPVGSNTRVSSGMTNKKVTPKPYKCRNRRRQTNRRATAKDSDRSRRRKSEVGSIIRTSFLKKSHFESRISGLQKNRPWQMANGVKLRRRKQPQTNVRQGSGREERLESEVGTRLCLQAVERTAK